MSVFNFSDYRAFLRDSIARLPKNGYGEVNRIAKYCDVHPSLISQVLGETKHLNLEQAQLAGEYLGLTNHESEFLLNLVQLERAGTEKLKKFFRGRIETLKKSSAELSQRIRQDRTLTEIEISTFYSHWLYAAVWVLTSLGHGATVAEAAEWAHVSRERATEVLQFLAQTGLCVQNENRFEIGPHSIHLPRGSVHLPKHHANWRIKAIEASDQISSEELMYSAPLSISKENFSRVREKLADAIKDVAEHSVGSEVAEGVACFNLDFFWLKK